MDRADTSQPERQHLPARKRHHRDRSIPATSVSRREKRVSAGSGVGCGGRECGFFFGSAARARCRLVPTAASCIDSRRYLHRWQCRAWNGACSLRKGGSRPAGRVMMDGCSQDHERGDVQPLGWRFLGVQRDTGHLYRVKSRKRWIAQLRERGGWRRAVETPSSRPMDANHPSHHLRSAGPHKPQRRSTQGASHTHERIWPRWVVQRDCKRPQPGPELWPKCTIGTI